MQVLLFGDELDEDNSKNTLKCKNIRQTGLLKYIINTFKCNFFLISNKHLNIFLEFLVDLRESIMQVARHFVIVDPKLSNLSLKPDYTKDSHSKDLETYANVSRNKKRRAKALLGKLSSF